jgi:hypothetical protein
LALATTACQTVTSQRGTPTATILVGPDVAALRVGQDVRVRMRVECTDGGSSTRATYLRPSCYFEGYNFRLVIPAERRPLFVESLRGNPESLLVDRMVDAQGIVQRNGPWSEIVLESANQLRLAAGLIMPLRVPTRVPTVEAVPTRG